MSNGVTAFCSGAVGVWYHAVGRYIVSALCGDKPWCVLECLVCGVGCSGALLCGGKQGAVRAIGRGHVWWGFQAVIQCSRCNKARVGVR